MHSFKPLLVDVRVHLRRRNIGVPEHFLNDPQIGAIAKQVGREAMPEKMWVNVFFESGALCVFFYDLPDALRGSLAASVAEKDFAGAASLHKLRPGSRAIGRQRSARLSIY